MNDMITRAIVKSESMENVKVAGYANCAPSTVYTFDKFHVEVCHNGRSEHPIMINGAKVSTISDDEFRDALKLRTERIKSEFRLSL